VPVFRYSTALGRVLAAEDVQPLLDVPLVLELRASPRSRCLEEGVEVELVELPGARDRQQLVRHLTAVLIRVDPEADSQRGRTNLQHLRV
jgi:hypothetical protein